MTLVLLDLLNFIPQIDPPWKPATERINIIGTLVQTLVITILRLREAELRR
jgi:hypothetical protein